MALDFEKLHFLHPNCQCFQANSFSSQAKAAVPQPGSVRLRRQDSAQRGAGAGCTEAAVPSQEQDPSHILRSAQLSSAQPRPLPSASPLRERSRCTGDAATAPPIGTPATRALPHGRRPPRGPGPSAPPRQAPTLLRWGFLVMS